VFDGNKSLISKNELIMKKDYMSPQTVSYTLAPVLPLAASKFSTETPGDQTITPDPTEPAPGEFTTRRRSQWDEEDDLF